MNRILASLGICAMFVLYTLSDSPDRDCLLFGAVIIAISDAADRMCRNRSAGAGE